GLWRGGPRSIPLRCASRGGSPAARVPDHRPQPQADQGGVPMTRFLTLLAVAAIAGAMYVAAAPGGLRSSGPTAKQFKLLTAKVTKLQKQVTNLKKEADASLGIEALCILHQPVGVDQLGTSSNGYLFGPPASGSTAIATSALNLAPSTEASP